MSLALWPLSGIFAFAGLALLFGVFYLHGLPGAKLAMAHHCHRRAAFEKSEPP